MILLTSSELSFSFSLAFFLSFLDFFLSCLLGVSLSSSLPSASRFLWSRKNHQWASKQKRIGHDSYRYVSVGLTRLMVQWLWNCFRVQDAMHTATSAKTKSNATVYISVCETDKQMYPKKNNEEIGCTAAILSVQRLYQPTYIYMLYPGFVPPSVRVVWQLSVFWS